MYEPGRIKLTPTTFLTKLLITLVLPGRLRGKLKGEISVAMVTGNVQAQTYML